eukprot:TRINITY_DN8923_c0_g1_i1.p1 TRINITY_DN8923_c0_g1~~TRINITY_DN8923_c0_g1_i1.p1  ORF type:complete len:186 (-),score=52.62 TRINITY_DN8923_c0_g1_i1:742-1299(-)
MISSSSSIGMRGKEEEEEEKEWSVWNAIKQNGTTPQKRPIRRQQFQPIIPKGDLSIPPIKKSTNEETKLERDSTTVETLRIKRKRNEEIRDLFVVDEFPSAPKKMKASLEEMVKKFSVLDPSLKSLLNDNGSNHINVAKIDDKVRNNQSKREEQSRKLFRYSHSIVDANRIRDYNRKLHKVIRLI